MTDKKELNLEEADNVAGGRWRIYGAVEPAPEVVPVSPENFPLIEGGPGSCPPPELQEKNADNNSGRMKDLL